MMEEQRETIRRKYIPFKIITIIIPSEVYKYYLPYINYGSELRLGSIVIGRVIDIIEYEDISDMLMTKLIVLVDCPIPMRFQGMEYQSLNINTDEICLFENSIRIAMSQAIHDGLSYLVAELFSVEDNIGINLHIISIKEDREVVEKLLNAPNTKLLMKINGKEILKHQAENPELTQEDIIFRNCIKLQKALCKYIDEFERTQQGNIYKPMPLDKPDETDIYDDLNDHIDDDFIGNNDDININ